MTAPEDQNGLREALARAEAERDAAVSKANELETWCDRAAVLIKRQQRWQTYGQWLEADADAAMANQIAEQRAKVNALRLEIKQLRAERDVLLAEHVIENNLMHAAEARARAAEAEITRLKEGMEARDAALRPFAAGGPWGGWLSWLINGAPDREQGKAAAKQIVHWRAAVDVVLSPKEHPHG